MKSFQSDSLHSFIRFEYKSVDDVPLCARTVRLVVSKCMHLVWLWGCSLSAHTQLNTNDGQCLSFEKYVANNKYEMANCKFKGQIKLFDWIINNIMYLLLLLYSGFKKIMKNKETHTHMGTCEWCFFSLETVCANAYQIQWMLSYTINLVHFVYQSQ